MKGSTSLQKLRNESPIWPQFTRRRGVEFLLFCGFAEWIDWWEDDETEREQEHLKARPTEEWEQQNKTQLRCESELLDISEKF